VKIPIKNLFYLLSYAWNVLDVAEEAEIGKIDASDFENLFARVLANRLEPLFRRGLDRDYQERREDSRYLRGRLNLQETTKRLLWIRSQVNITADDLSSDTLANRIIKSSLNVLLHFESLDPGNREELAGLHHAMRDVPTVNVAPGDFYRVRLHLNNIPYLVVLSLCEMLQLYALPAEHGSGMRFVDFNRAKMWKVFQQFVRNFYAQRQTVYSVNADALGWRDSGPLHPHPHPHPHHYKVHLPRLNTDIVLSCPEKKIVVDTKYVSKPLALWQGRIMLQPGHLNQIFAYMQNIAAADRQGRPVEGILLYAGAPAPFIYDWRLFGAKLRTAAVDLSRDWQEIDRQLLEIIEIPKCDQEQNGGSV
jgi:5-methylcytosine-specific restriction enzyme subunit McrC